MTAPFACGGTGIFVLPTVDLCGFRASCNCDFDGPRRPTREDAVADAREHLALAALRGVAS